MLIKKLCLIILCISLGISFATAQKMGGKPVGKKPYAHRGHQARRPTQKTRKAPKSHSLTNEVERAALIHAQQTQDLFLADFHVQTGSQLLSLWSPSLYHHLSARFSHDEIKVIQQALTQTDDLFFHRDATGNTTLIPGEDWDYASIFSSELETVLRNKGISFSQAQWSFLFAGRNLGHSLKGITLETFLLQHQGRWPSSSLPNSPEGILYRDVSHLFKRHPETKLVQDMQDWRQVSIGSTSRLGENARGIQLVSEVKQFLQAHNNCWPSASSDNPQEKALQGKIRMFMKLHPTSPLVSQLQLLRQQAQGTTVRTDITVRTENLLVQVQQFMQKHDGLWPSAHSGDPVERQLYQQIVHTFERDSENPATRQLQDLKEHASGSTVRPSANQQSQMLLAQMNSFLQKSGGKWPSSASTDPAEKHLYQVAQKLITRYPNHPALEPVIQLRATHQVTQTGRVVGSISIRGKTLQQALGQFLVSSQNRWPSLSSLDDAERLLAKRIHYFIQRHPDEPSTHHMVNLKKLAKKSADKERIRQVRRQQLEQKVARLADELQNFRQTHEGSYPSVRSRNHDEYVLYTKIHKLLELYPQDPLVQTLAPSGGDL